MADAKISADTTKITPIAADYVPGIDSEESDPTLKNKKFLLGTIPAGSVTNGVYTTGAGTVFQPAPYLQYVLDADLTPVIPAAGAECRWNLGVDTDGTTHTGITAARTINAPITGTPVDGQTWYIRIYDNGTVHNVTFNAAFTLVGVTMASNIIASNGTINKAVVVAGRYNKAAGKWQVLGISYE